ncbi:MAG: UDP-3-O-(3-hydroxymyristoyl)glucosamine N-acyltransferase [Candidatus Oxydemutatoraceae bacterium WSBS_2016_MAG_OTU14]
MALTYRLSELAKHVEGNIVGNDEAKIIGVSAIESAQPGQITFLSDQRYAKHLQKTQATAVVLSEQNCPQQKQMPQQSFLTVENPSLSFAQITRLFIPRYKPQAGVDSSANIHPSCSIGQNVYVGPGVSIEAEVHIGDDCEIAANCVIGPYSSLGKGCILEANVSLNDKVQLGEGVLIHAGATIGFDGFGLVQRKGHWVKVPQCGGVSIGNHSEIGCNTTIDRGTFEDTVLGEDVRIDNLVQIAHNVNIGSHTAIAAGTLIAGSAKIGKHCMLGGGSKINGHIEIADHVILAGDSYVAKSVQQVKQYTQFVNRFRLMKIHKQLNQKIIRLKKQMQLKNNL